MPDSDLGVEAVTARAGFGNATTLPHPLHCWRLTALARREAQSIVTKAYIDAKRIRDDADAEAASILRQARQEDWKFARPPSLRTATHARQRPHGKRA